MSISPFHGGLVFHEGSIDSTYPQQIQKLKATVGQAQQVKTNSHEVNKDDLNNRDINEFYNPNHSKLTLQERYDECMSVGEDVVTNQELFNLLEKKPLFNCYDGFEPSGRMHIAQGIMKAINVNKITNSGGVFTFWVADWFALLNNKMGGDLHKIQVVGRYFVEVWKAAGMNLSNVRFLWASDEINKRPDEYWSRVMDISRKNNITRIKKCGTIMGRGEGDDLPTS